MTLPSTGGLNASGINAEIQRPWNQQISLSDGTVRNLAGRPSGSISFSDLRGKTFTYYRVVNGSGVRGRVVCRDFFTDAEWLSNVPKYVENPPGLEIVDNVRDSWAMIVAHGNSAEHGYGGTLTIINNGTISGCHGWVNSGAGGHALNLNIRGRNNQVTTVINNGHIRGGGGGGGRGGTGGRGGAGYNRWISYWNDLGSHYGINPFNQSAGTHWSQFPYNGISYRTWFDGWQANMGLDETFAAAAADLHFYRSHDQGFPNPPFWHGYNIHGHQAVYAEAGYEGGWGGAGGQGAHGVGYGNSDSGNGRQGGAGGTQGGTNAGWGGTGGTGGWGGGWGSPGGQGEGGGRGTDGNNGAGQWGSGGEGGGQAGAWVINNHNGALTNNNWVQGNFW